MEASIEACIEAKIEASGEASVEASIETSIEASIRTRQGSIEARYRGIKQAGANLEEARGGSRSEYRSE